MFWWFKVEFLKGCTNDNGRRCHPMDRKSREKEMDDKWSSQTNEKEKEKGERVREKGEREKGEKERRKRERARTDNAKKWGSVYKTEENIKR